MYRCITLMAEYFDLKLSFSQPTSGREARVLHVFLDIENTECDPWMDRLVGFGC
jgi:hypothetical protein